LTGVATSLLIGVLGNGEVGAAVSGLYGEAEIFLKDLTEDNFPERLDLLHVCIPWSDIFVDDVVRTIVEKTPEIVIIHSTVPVGTTKNIGRIAVHSPIRGKHPDLLRSLRTFIKFIGCDDPMTGKIAADHLESLGVPVRLVCGSETTEMLKLLDTTYYATCIAFHGYAKSLCDKTGADFSVAMTEANETYNEGYKKLGMSWVARPVLSPPEDRIGGHCLIPNAEILFRQFGGNGIIDEVLKLR
jgi:hypothetical protein